MPAYHIREMLPTEYAQLEEFLYQSIFQRDPRHPIPRTVLRQPEIRVYIEDFGGPDDHCLVAEVEGALVGAVWTRIFSGPAKGFGHVDAETPEFAISLLENSRGQGIGTALMEHMLVLLRAKGYRKASLAVQKDNYALRMYQALGFEIAGEDEEEYIMVYQLGEE